MMSTSTILKTIDFIKDKAKEFGAEEGKEYVFRNNSREEALKKGGAYFGFIRPDEPPTGGYHDFSFVIFPSNNDRNWLVCLGIGTLGFKNDYELASLPGPRRLFSKLIDKNEGYCKTNFLDIESSLPANYAKKDNVIIHKKTFEMYKKVLPVCQVVSNPEDDSGETVIAGFLAAYAKLREWPDNSTHRENVLKAQKELVALNARDLIQEEIDEESDILNLLGERRYIVLQGPPGTGKTRMAKRIANKKGKTFFTQFHAETSYSDFIYGIRPDTDKDTLRYIESRGIFIQALEHASENKDEEVVLIIDEINRANLSNILGPIFYLFEHKMDSTSDIEIEIAPNVKYSKLPDNLYVIATMNTADRSLAVVDFALRRRFAWYTKKPKAINTIRGRFFRKHFDKFDSIFEWHASNTELNLQPGEGYFIADSPEEMNNRIRYELFPLIKEYLQEGIMRSATEEFDNYFLNEIRLSLYE